MPLVVTRFNGETWLQAARRLAQPYGLESEVTQSFEAARKEGATEEDAALYAAIEWDVAAFEDWGDDVLMPTVRKPPVLDWESPQVPLPSSEWSDSETEP
jgi:hypothetical protein